MSPGLIPGFSLYGEDYFDKVLFVNISKMWTNPEEFPGDRLKKIVDPTLVLQGDRDEAFGRVVRGVFEHARAQHDQHADRSFPGREPGGPARSRDELRVQAAVAR